LAITKKFVELHGGKIVARSRLGEGSQFTFTLLVSSEQINLLPPTPALIERPLTTLKVNTEGAIDDNELTFNRIMIVASRC
jgi:hypothetical protein